MALELSPGPLRPRTTTRRFATLPLVFPLLLLGSCGGGGGSGGAGSSTGSAELVSVQYGRTVDVYGLKRSSNGSTAQVLYERDVLVGSDVQDERDSNSTKRDEEILFDFISSDADTLQLRLLITREIGTKTFQDAYDSLGAKLRLVAPAVYGQNTSQQPYTVVPRNGALQLTFSQQLAIDDSFFYQRDASSGLVTGLKNTEAVQVLKIVGDPLDASASGDFEVIPCRIVVKANRLILDPVLLGNEGLQYQSRNSAAGLPEAPNQVGGNVRVALSLTGPLRMPDLRADAQGLLVGTNNSGVKSVIRDFRAGNAKDNTAEIAQGFVRDPVPPRLVGQIPMYLEAVEPRDDLTMLVTIYKGPVVEHELDRGDAIRIVIDNSGVPVAVTEITENPLGDQGQPKVKHVQAVVRRVDRMFAADVDPKQKPGYPADPESPAGEAWLVANAPKAIVVAEFAADKGLDTTSTPYGDDPRYFLTFSPAPLPDADGTPSLPNQNVSPAAAAIVRFTKPVDLATVKGLDTFFFSTRNVLDAAAIEAFITAQGIDKAAFRHEKFRTPHLVGAKAFDEDGSQTAVRLQTPLGFFLNEAMRTATTPYSYYTNLVGGTDGIRDLSGNPLDFQSTTVRDALVVPFTLDTRKTASGQPYAADNLAVTIARRYAGIDEDEQPSYYLSDEVPVSGTNPNAYKAYNLQDMFGAIVLLSDGSMQSRPGVRVRRIVDDLNQLPPPAQSSNLRWCPLTVSGGAQVIVSTAGAKFGAPLQNPLNPWGCRLQTVWREIDMSLSRTDAFDFNLDVEQMYWGPYTGAPITYDVFDRMSLYLGHSEWRPEPCVDAVQSLASLPNTGLVTSSFLANYLNNPGLTGARETAPAEFRAFADKTLTIDASLAITEPNGVNRFLPLPKFEKPYFVWRNELVREQGCNSTVSTDSTGLGANQAGRTMQNYILSPFLGGLGRYVIPSGATTTFAQGTWNSLANFKLSSASLTDSATGGMVGAIGCPLLADFWMYPDSATAPANNPFLATGYNGWQISLAVTSGPSPYFRAYSAGGFYGGKGYPVDTSSPKWATPSGGFTPTGGATSAVDNSVFWIMADFVKRQTVVTAGFVEITNPHRMPATLVDPRLGPYTAPAGYLPRFSYDFEPPLTSLPGGTAVIPEFRGAGPVDKLSVPAGQPGMPWRAAEDRFWPSNFPDDQNFPLDPLKAGDAHIRKFDDRKNPPSTGLARNTWTYNYNRNLTTYIGDPNALMDTRFTSTFAGPTESFLPADVKYFNWRFIMQSNVDTTTPISPKLESFTVTYRFEKTN